MPFSTRPTSRPASRGRNRAKGALEHDIIALQQRLRERATAPKVGRVSSAGKATPQASSPREEQRYWGHWVVTDLLLDEFEDIVRGMAKRFGSAGVGGTTDSQG